MEGGVVRGGTCHCIKHTICDQHINNVHYIYNCGFCPLLTFHKILV